MKNELLKARKLALDDLSDLSDEEYDLAEKAIDRLLDKIEELEDSASVTPPTISLHSSQEYE